MTKLVWSNPEPVVTQGLSHGVVYPPSGLGVVWNGLTEIDEGRYGGEQTPLYLDGQKYLDYYGLSVFNASVSSYGIPPELEGCIGDVSILPGVILTNQPKLRFSFTYRVELGNGLGHKLHVVYNALATRSDRDRNSLEADIEPALVELNIETLPETIPGYGPTSHFVVDSTQANPYVYADLESKLYGGVNRKPSIPTFAEMLKIYNDLITEPLTEPL